VPYSLVIPDAGPALAMTSRAGAHARVTDALSLAALNEGDALSLTRLQNMLNLTPGNLATHIRKLEDAGYLTSETTRGRAALDVYTDALRNLLRGLAP
jgi:DNA-binding MarR family transcriptional regulator